MTNKLLISTALVMLTTSAFAADLPSHQMAPVYLPPPLPVFTWTGLYVGGQVGYAFGEDGLLLHDEDGLIFYGKKQHSSGVTGGAHIGYNYAMPVLGVSGIIVGLEADVDGSDASSSLLDPEDVELYTLRKDIEGSFRARIGYAFDRTLLYATGGVAVADFHQTALYRGDVDSGSKTKAGFTVGGGIEYALTPNWSIRGEYRYTEYDSVAFSLPNTFGEVYSTRHIADNKVQVGFSYLFTSPVVPVVARY